MTHTLSHTPTLAHKGTNRTFSKTARSREVFVATVSCSVINSATVRMIFQLILLCQMSGVNWLSCNSWVRRHRRTVANWETRPPITCLLRADGVRWHAGLSAAQDVAGDDLELVIHPGHQADHAGRLGVALDVSWIWMRRGCDWLFSDSGEGRIKGIIIHPHIHSPVLMVFHCDDSDDRPMMTYLPMGLWLS